MIHSTCDVCSEHFTAKSKNKKYCSSRCKWRARPKLPCFVCGGATGWSTSSKRHNPTCSDCLVPQHGEYSRYRKGCRCSLCRDANNAYNREWRKNARERGWEPATRKAKRLTCDWCGVLIKSRTGAADGLVLCKPHRDSVSTWGGGWIRRDVRESIYERDQWECQICFTGTSKVYTVGDHWAPTLDHVVPRSKGGSDDPSNLRLVHSWCNSLRGDRDHYSDEELRSIRFQRMPVPIA